MLPAYAPHNGHTEAERGQRWEEVSEILNQTMKKTHMIMWRADANGQIGREKKKKIKNPQETATYKNRTIKEQKAEKRHGTQLAKICQSQQMIPMATWK